MRTWAWRSRTWAGVPTVSNSRNADLRADLQHVLAWIYILVGEPEWALDRVEPLLKLRYYFSPGWLRINPTFAPLRDNPRFERLVMRRWRGEWRGVLL